ncbi:translation initiation factor IF-2 [Velocimicrobium porci]|uniref:Translation initiation factor IF-2 n=1 Tax=Velocimicrobium porci TaxID=2606634 RepID=A0A6L5XWW1_9FIRM|nr:translation initiation factor IF-2 [Velocimicrobium porci]MSS63330.1 translation initiation factor IF-2 [Velocimicrobium porci]
MAKMKIYEIAKSLNTKSSDLVKALNENGFEVKSHNSNIEDDAIAFVLKHFAPKKEDTKALKQNEIEKVESKVTEEVREVKVTEKKVEESKIEVKTAELTNESKQKNENEKKPEEKVKEAGRNNNRNSTERNNNRNNNDRNSNRNKNNSQNNNERNNNRNNRNNTERNNNRNNNRFNNNERKSPNSDRRQQGNDRNNNRTQNNNRFGGNNFEHAISFDTPSFDKGNSRKNDYNNKNSRNDKNRNNKKYRNDNDMPSKKEKDPNRKGAFIMPKPVVKEPETEDTIKTITLPETMTIRDLADKMKQPAASVVKKLFLQGKMVSINQEISFEEAEEIALEFNCIAELEEQVDVIEEILKEDEEDESTLEKRPPVVCVMGHVDHGKTSLLDAIRQTSVTEKEAGGITQHIGAYTVNVNGEKITFLDTPGHEAFTSMRMRGAKSTDIAILVVAADDGVMPQTVEAISHAKAAEVEIIVAINKIDKPGANIERVKQELSEYELIAEDWGGSTVFVPVSAKTKEGLDQLLEMILLTAEVSELKANPNRKARGIVIEAQLDKGRGPVATILVQKGTLHVGDSIVIGSAHGKVRAMVDDKGRRVKEATPSTPVEILGLNEVPDAGEIFMATENDKEARSIAEAYIKQGREKLLAETKSKLSLDGLFSQIQAGNIKELNLIVKADVQGSVEAVKQSLLKLSNEEVAIRIIHGGVGAINESDVTLASASNAIIIGFNVRPDPTAKDIAEREKVDLRLYKVIYNAIEDIEAAMKGMLDPVFEEKIIGHAEVRQTFKASGVGMIAGSYVLDGKIVRGCKARVTRDGEVIFDGDLASLKRFKDDVKEVASGYECGLVFEKFNDIKEEDKVELYVMEEVPR